MNLFIFLSRALLEMDIGASENKEGSTDVKIQPIQHKNADNSTLNRDHRKILGDEKPPLKKRRKVDSLVEGGYTRVSQTGDNTFVQSSEAPIKVKVLLSISDEKPTASSSSPVEEIWWQCKSCDRRFKSEQGIKTHVYMMHILGGDDAAPDIAQASIPSLKCDICGKLSPNKDAFDQHAVAKHSGMFQSVKPSWAADQSQAVHVTPGEVDSLHECKICGITFFSNDQLQSHLNGWQPMTSATQLSCLKCAKNFRDDRALKQHMNNCYKSN